LLSGTEVLRCGTLTVEVGEHRESLLVIREGLVPWEEIDAWRKRLHIEFDQAYRETKLPERPDYELANRFLLKARRSALND
jgi:hypothetical protein